MCPMLEWFSEARACASNATRTGNPLENRVSLGEVKGAPSSRLVLVSQFFSSAHQRYDVPVNLSEQHIIRHEVVDAEDDLTAALSDAAAEFLAGWLTQTPQDRRLR